jgi:hypothetical protein
MSNYIMLRKNLIKFYLLLLIFYEKLWIQSAEFEPRL